MSPIDKVAIIKSFASEIIKEEELVKLFTEKEAKGEDIIAYDGFEPSGNIHIAQGLMRAITVNKMTSLGGFKFKFWVADWFGMLNNKMSGDLKKIRVVGEYFIEVWKACGMDLDNVEFVWTSDFIESHPEYWTTVLKLSMNTTVQRVLRCGQIMGREDSTSNPAAQIIYPIMQAADIHHLNADIAQLGMDQRKVNMLARDVFPKLGLKAPIAIHHHMLMGLHEQQSDLKSEFNALIGHVKAGTLSEASELISLLAKKVQLEFPQEKLLEDVSGGVTANKKEAITAIVELRDKYGAKLQTANKMSKSKPNSAIFMTDSTDDINRKFKKAYCPQGQAAENPVLEYLKHIVFEKFDTLTIERDERFGGNVTYNSYDEVEAAFVAEEIHPVDLKNATAKCVDALLAPIRDHFENDSRAKELKTQVESFLAEK